MKKSIRLLLMLALALSVLCALSLTVSAADPTYGDLSYKLSGGQVTITDLSYNFVGDLEIPSKISGHPVVAIADRAFQGNVGLKSVVIPDSVTNIGEQAFIGCSNLRSVRLPDRLTSLSDKCFKDCSALTAITIPDTVTAIGNYALAGCSRLTTLTIPEGVTSIGDYAFSDCIYLTDIALPDTLTTIGRNAFCDCTSLPALILPDKVTGISQGMFYNCSSLTKLIVPKNVTEVGSSAFYGCNSLEYIVFLGDAPIFEDYAFQNTTTTVYYTAGTMFWATEMKDHGGSIIWKERQPLKITSQPKTVYVRYKDTAKLTVKATGDGVTYRWYIKDAGSKKYTRSSVTSRTYSTTMTTTTKDRYAYCVLTDLYGVSITTNVVRLRMAATITKQPVNTGAAVGEKLTVKVRAMGDGLTYKWYYKDEGMTSFKKASTTGSQYSVTMTDARDDRQVYCVVTDKYGKTHKSRVVTIGIDARLSSQPKTAYARLGSKAKVSVKAVGDGLKYQWYIKNVGSSKYSKSSVTTATYSATMSSSTRDRLVYCIVTDQYGNSIKTKTVRLRMAASITKQPVSKTVAEGSKASVKISALGDGLTYTWYYKEPDGGSFRKASSTTASYSVTMTEARDGRQVYCVVTDKYGKTVTSKTVTLYMD